MPAISSFNAMRSSGFMVHSPQWPAHSVCGSPRTRSVRATLEAWAEHALDLGYRRQSVGHRLSGHVADGAPTRTARDHFESGRVAPFEDRLPEAIVGHEQLRQQYPAAIA